MTGVLLCAGYATRLYPLTRKRPKALLPVAGKPILDYAIEKLRAAARLSRVTVVSNDPFYAQFDAWRAMRQFAWEVRVLNDGTRSNETRLGAIRDLELALRDEPEEQDVVVLAGDNIFDFDLSLFFKRACARPDASTVGVYDVRDKELARRYGLVELDRGGRVSRFLEKPEHPPTTLASMGLYYFPSSCRQDLKAYFEAGGKPDAPGYFVDWLSQKKEVYAHVFQGVWFDIGDAVSYEEAGRVFAEKRKTQHG